MMYMPRTPLSGFTTSVTMRPLVSDSDSSGTPQVFANRARTRVSPTGW